MCLLKTGACLLQVYFNVLDFFRICKLACSIQVPCLIEVATKTGFTEHKLQGTIAPFTPIQCNINLCHNPTMLIHDPTTEKYYGKNLKSAILCTCIS